MGIKIRKERNCTKLSGASPRNCVEPWTDGNSRLTSWEPSSIATYQRTSPTTSISYRPTLASRISITPR